MKRSPLPAGAPLRRATRLTPSPRRVTADERHTRRIVRARSGDRCERCGMPATNMSHRKPVSQGGLWQPSNVTHLCGMGNASGCHGWCHQNPVGANRLGWVLKSWQDPEVEPVLYPDGTRWILDDEGGRREA